MLTIVDVEVVLVVVILLVAVVLIVVVVRLDLSFLLKLSRFLYAFTSASSILFDVVIVLIGVVSRDLFFRGYIDMLSAGILWKLNIRYSSFAVCVVIVVLLVVHCTCAYACCCIQLKYATLESVWGRCKGTSPNVRSMRTRKLTLRRPAARPVGVRGKCHGMKMFSNLYWDC